MVDQPKIVQLLKSQSKGVGLTSLSNETGVSRTALWSMQRGKNVKYRKQTLDVLYDYFDLEQDDFYRENMKRWHPPTFSVIGNIMRQMRIRKGLSIDEVASLLKGSKREVFRIEAGDSLPSYRSWYMTEMLDLYDATEQERELIRRGVTILKDLMQINNRMDPIEQNKGHGKKTVVRI